MHQPISREEFDCALQAPAAMVKGRGMNDHLNRVWNAVDAYVEGNQDKLTADQQWLIDWRDANYPDARVAEALKSWLNKTPPGGYEDVYNAIKHMDSTGFGDKKVLLRIIALSHRIENNKDEYDKLASTLPT